MKRFWISLILLAVWIMPVLAAESKELVIWQTYNGGAEMVLRNVAKDFQAKHPDIQLLVEKKTFDDLKTTVRLNLANNEGPDITIVNQGLNDMGILAQEGLVIPLDRYIAKYHWDKVLGSSMLRPNRFNVQTMSIGDGPLYAISFYNEFNTVLYNKDLFKKANINSIPTTMPQFEAVLKKLKKQRITPIVFGNSDTWPGIHIFQFIFNSYASRQLIDDLVFATGKAHWNISPTLKAAKKLQDWAKQGYFSNGYSGIGYDDSIKMFAAGQGAMLITGNWAIQSAVQNSENSHNIGIFKAPTPIVFGAPSTGLGIAKKCKNPDLAAELLNDLIVDTRYHVANSILPLIQGEGNVKTANELYNAQYPISQELTKKDALGYYFDWATPTMYNTISAAIQNLMAGRISAAEFGKTLDQDYDAFLSKKIQK